jgi:restriction system protein
LFELGGSETNDEINNKVISLMNIPEIILNIMHGDTLQTESFYLLALVRTMLKNQASIENSQ